MNSTTTGAVAGLIVAVAVIILVLSDRASRRERRVVGAVLTLCVVAVVLRVVQFVIT